MEEARRAGVTVGFVAGLVGERDDICAWKPEEPRIPASCEKLLTAGAALLALGPEHLLVTDLLADGTRSGAVLRGNLRIRGEGDPTLVSRGENAAPGALARRLAADGVQRVTGDLVVDDRLFTDARRGSNWPQAPPTRAWMAVAAPLSLDHGTVTVVVSAGDGVGKPGRVELRPRAAGLRIENRLETCARSSEHVIDVQSGADDDHLVVTGKVVLGTREQAFEVAIGDPAIVFGRLVLRALEDAGVEIDGHVRRAGSRDPVTGGTLVMRLATPVASVLPVMLEESQNHRAEMLLKHLGAAFGAGTFAGGAAAVLKAYEDAGAPLGGSQIADGSGLSRDNRTTAADLVTALRALWRSSSRDTLRTALATGGEGTLRHRLQGLGPRVQAKTGTLSGVSTLSGYVDTAGGETIAFAILMESRGISHSRMRALQDRLVCELAGLGSTR